MTNSNLAIIWTKHLKTQEEKDDFKKLLLNSSIITQRISDILEEELATEFKIKSSIKDYSNTDWAYKQAHRNGRIEAYRSMLELFKFLRPKR